MSERADAWMPLYIADYLKDTRHLSTTEHGAYLLLLMYAWTNGGALPLDDRRLARIAGLDQEEWKESAAVLLAFFTADAEAYRQKRVDEEMVRASANLEQKRAAGRASAAQRALQRDGQREGNGRSTDVATDRQRDTERIPQRKGNSSPSPSPESSLRSDSPRAPDLFAGQSAEVKAVLDAGKFASVPDDARFVREWLSLPDMQLERDILPIVRRMAGESMAARGRPPYRFKFFDAAIREKHAADEAEIARLRASRALAEKLDREQAERDREDVE